MKGLLWLGLWSVTVVGCDRGYPLPPTLCDDWCETAVQHCEGYSPASCVSQCELEVETGFPCGAEQQAVMKCVNATPGAADSFCFSDMHEGAACLAETHALSLCQLGGEEGVARDECSYYCSVLASANCDFDSQLGCEADCLERGLAAAVCYEQRAATQQCLWDNSPVCDESGSGSGGASGGEPCRAQQAALEECGAHALSAVAGASG